MKVIILGLLGVSFFSIVFMPEALAVKTAIEASGNVAMNSTLKSYQDSVLQSITKECLAHNAAKETVVSLTVDPHGNIMRITLSKSGLSPDGMMPLISALKALRLGDAGTNQSDTLRITMDFDLAEVLAGAKSTGTSISIKGGNITGDGTATGGIRIGGGGSISAGGGNISINQGAVQTNALSHRPQAISANALNKLAELEKSPDSNLQDLCNSRLVMSHQYWRAEDLTKARDLLEQALKYLEGPAGPLSRETTRDLQRITQSLIASQTPGDQDLLWRIYAAIERKAPGGCTDFDLAQLARLNLPKGSEGNGDKMVSVVSMVSRLLELREMREGAGSPKLIAILKALATTNESQHNYDAAIAIEQRIARIQKQNGVSSEAEAMTLLTAARLCVLGDKFAQAISNEQKAIEIVSQEQSADTLKAKLAPDLAALSSAYIGKTNMLDDADRVVREAIDMAAYNHSPHGHRDFDYNACTANLIERYRQIGQFQKAIALLEDLLEKPNIAPELTINTWRYELAGLYLDQSRAKGGPSTHKSKAAKEMLRKSKLFFDTALANSKNDGAINKPDTERFVHERIETLQKYGMKAEARELEAQQSAGSSAMPEDQNAKPQPRE